MNIILSYIQMNQAIEWKEKVERNKELLQMYRKLEELEESCWGKFFRFEKSHAFIQFEKRYSIPGVLRFRIDDGIYFLVLAVIIVVFCVLPSQSDHELTSAFRQFLIFYGVASVVWLLTPHWYKHLVYFFFCVVFPLLVLLIYYNIITFDPINTETKIFSYLGMLSLWGVYGLVYFVYPLKQFVRMKIGSLYSYLYALSFATLFVIWPTYSLLEEYVKNSAVTFDFVTDNQPLIITFLIIIVFSFHLFTHNSQFEGNINTVRKSLLVDFTKGEMLRALEEKEQQEQSCFYRNFNIYTRVMSLILFLVTVGVVIYSFIYLTNNLTQLYKTVGIMIFSVVFLVYGTIINIFTSSRAIVLLIFSIVSLLPVCFSPLFYHLKFQEYIALSVFLPYSTIFWCIVRSLSQRRPILKINVLVILFVFLHVPVMIFVLNSFQMLTTDTGTIQIINYCIIGIISTASVVGIISFIVWLCKSVKELPKEETVVDQTIDYNYYEDGNPEYVPYKKEESFSLAWLGSLDIKNMGELFSSICFIVGELATFYIFNELNYLSLASTTFTNNNNIRHIISSQFFITFVYFLYSYTYIIVSPTSVVNILFTISLFIGGIVGVSLSYTLTVTFTFTLRMCGGFCFGLFIFAIAFSIVKDRNQKVVDFLCPVIIVLGWFLLIVPYGIAIPIVSIYYESEFFLFVYGVILATTVLMIILVSAVSIIFNILMNKFEQEKKVKFMIEDVQTFLREEGIEPEDEVMHVLFQSFENRDKKYVFFLKRGYPIRLFRDASSSDDLYKTIVYNQEDLYRQGSLTKISEPEVDHCWACLTCLCGKDEEELEENVAKAVNKHLVDEEELEALFPKNYLKGILKNTIESSKERLKDPSMVYSTKSLILRNMTKIDRNLGDEYSLLKSKKNRKIVLEMWHEIFNFISNDDDPPKKVIFNDFLIFCRASELGLSDHSVNTVYRKISNASWNEYISMDISEFALAVEALASEVYSTKYSESLNSSTLLVERVYYNLCQYSEFQDILHSKQFKQKESNFGNSPFENNYANYQEFSEKFREKDQKFQKKVREYQQTKLIEPGAEEKRQRDKIVQVKQKQKSCKRRIYDKYIESKNCCGKEQEDSGVVKRKKIKPWDFLAPEITRILQHKQVEWREKSGQQEYVFRPIFNNFLVAAFKLADLYTYVQITIFNPNINWQNLRFFQVLIIQYRIQLYIAFALVAICLVFGIKGITLIFEDRLGLTQTRIPAPFPHPMFFFTVVYKLLVLASFNTIIMTLFSSFACDWTTTADPHSVIVSTQALQCFSTEHNIYLIFSLLCIFIYYPLSTYTMPNFQFAEKRLDLKYKPSYMIMYFQVNFVLAAGKVLLHQIDVQNATNSVYDYIFMSINIFSLALLAVIVIIMKPCLISWFNYIQFLVVWIGLVWNILGLVLYIYKDQVIICYSVAGGVTVLSIIICIIVIRLKFFSDNKVHVEADHDEIEELQQRWQYKKEIGVNIIKYQNREEDSREIKTRVGSHKNIQRVEVQDLSND